MSNGIHINPPNPPADKPLLRPGDEFTVLVPMYPRWARKFPAWLARFVPEKKVLHRGIWTSEGHSTTLEPVK